MNLRIALRSLVRRPGSSLISIITLATGMCLWLVTSATYHGRFLRQLPVPGAADLVIVSQQTSFSVTPIERLRYKDFHYLRQSTTSLEQFVGYQTRGMNLSGIEGPPERSVGAAVSRGFFAALDVRPATGRLFNDEEWQNASQPVAIISQRLWKSRFGGGESLLGETSFSLYGVPTSIIGVMPEGFHFPYNHDVWTPLSTPETPEAAERTLVSVFARLAPGLSPGQATSELQMLAERLRSENSEEYGELISFRSVPFVEAHIDSKARSAHLALVGIVIVVCLMAAICVAGLALIRLSRRSGELVLRAALGARWIHMLLLLLVESSVVAGAGVLLGIGAAAAFLRVQESVLPVQAGGYWSRMELSPPVILAGVLLSFAMSALGALIPMLQIRWRRLNASLASSRSVSATFRKTLPSLLVVSLIALTMPLVAATSLIVQNIGDLEQRELRGLPDRSLAAQISLTGERFPGETERLSAYRNLESDLLEQPAITAVGLVFPALPGQQGLIRSVALKDPETSELLEPQVAMSIVSPGFFSTFQLRALDGRLFDSRDTPDSPPVAVVNRSLAKRFFRTTSPVQRQIQAGGIWREVVGVVDDLSMAGVGADVVEGIYIPLTQLVTPRANLVVASESPPELLINRVRETAARIAPESPLYLIQTMDEFRRQILSEQILARTLSMVFGAVALLLTSIALFGLVASQAAQRKRELAIRFALGATRRQVRLMMLRNGLRYLAIATPIGILLAFYGGKISANLVPGGLSWSLSSGLVMLGAVGLIVVFASLVPAIQATRSITPAALQD